MERGNAKLHAQALRIEKARTETGTGFPNKSSLLVQTKLLVEAADTSARIHHLLLAGEKGVTLGANLHLNVLLGRTGLDHVTTGALDGGLLVVGMDAFLHECSPLSDVKK